MTKEKNTGAYEWCKSTVNIADGCEHDCVYCYAKRMAIRFGRKTNETWKEMCLREECIKKGYKKRRGRIMFPSSHDITPNIIDECIIVLKKLLEAGNEVLITTKPHHECVKRMCNELEPYKDLMLFRFTITSASSVILKRYEPNAPSFLERLTSLEHACRNGFKTSISIEPFLDMNPLGLIIILDPFVTDTIWIGKLNYQKEVFNTVENCKKIIKKIERLPEKYKEKIRYKDSLSVIKNKYNL